MIVKNESKIITRLLDSVLPMVDYYCICDTGSTDDTVDIITTFFEKHKIEGKITNEPFRDFAYNRTYSLHQCSDIPAEYLLLLDADMVLDTSNIKDMDEFKNSLTLDGYHVFQGTDSYFYRNIRILKNDPSFSYWGVTHEYVKFPEFSETDIIEKSVLFINDIGDGGSKVDKFERDIRLLKKGLEDLPNDPRYTFYLANSYRDAGQHENAIEKYKKRIEIGGWVEEVWYSFYSIGCCYRNLNDMPNAIFYWIEGYEKIPDRLENLYEIIKYYRENSKNKISNIFCEFAKYELKKKTNFDHLFLQNDIYSYKIDYEDSINGYYVNPHKDMRISCMKVINNKTAPKHILDNVLSNYKFYSRTLPSKQLLSYNLDILNNIGKDVDKNLFNPSTPSLCINHNKKELILCRRFVNYKITPNGEYINEKNIITKNVIATIDINGEKWNKKDEFELKYDTTYDDLFIGIEDVRIFLYDGLLFFNGNRATKPKTICVEHGKINLFSKQTSSNIIKCANQCQIEKNWVLFQDSSKKMKMIYNWYPLTIGNPEDHHPESLIDEKNKRNIFLKITDNIEMPPIFKNIRGSTNGINIDDEIWFICHIVSYENRRYYYHIVVVIDSTSYKLKRFTKLFTFEKEKIEYTLGFDYIQQNGEFLIGYSTMDNCTKYILASKKDIEELFYES